MQCSGKVRSTSWLRELRPKGHEAGQSLGQASDLETALIVKQAERNGEVTLPNNLGFDNPMQAANVGVGPQLRTEDAHQPASSRSRIHAKFASLQRCIHTTSSA